MPSAILLGILVGCVNVALNLTIREAANPGKVFVDSFGKLATFALVIAAFLIGSLSLAAMFGFYRLDGNLARGLILMGTVSIVIGSVATMILTRTLADTTELCLLGTLTLLFAFRWLRTYEWFRQLIGL